MHRWPPPFFAAACSPLQTLKNRAASAPLAPPLFPPVRFPLQRACIRSFPYSGSSQFIFGPVASCCRNPWKTGPGVHRVPPPPFSAASWRLQIHQNTGRQCTVGAPSSPQPCSVFFLLCAAVRQPAKNRALGSPLVAHPSCSPRAAGLLSPPVGTPGRTGAEFSARDPPLFSSAQFPLQKQLLAGVFFEDCCAIILPRSLLLSGRNRRAFQRFPTAFTSGGAKLIGSLAFRAVPGLTAF